MMMKPSFGWVLCKTERKGQSPYGNSFFLKKRAGALLYHIRRRRKPVYTKVT
jgi:hypothetical protein